MATARRRRSKKKTAAPKRRRRARKVAAAPKRRRRHAKKKAAVTRRRRRRVVRVEAKRSRRRRAAPAATRRRRRRVSAWKGDAAGHAKAAKKGHRRRRAARKTTKRRRRRSKAREVTYAAAPRRRRRRSARRSSHVMETSRKRHRRHRMHASRGGGGMGVGEMVIAIGTAGVGFVLADGLDRLLATYNPSGTTVPTDKFTSNGTGTLANTLNVAAMPNWKRAAAGVGAVAVPAIGSMFVKSKYARGALEGLALGAGVSAFKTLWSNVLMPMLIGKDTSAGALQKSYIARLYPAEVAAHINKKQAMPAPGALSGSPDVGPFALADSSPYPDAAQALRAGVSGDSPYPSANDALRAGVSGDSPYPSASQALRTGVSAGPTPTGGPDSSWSPGPPPGVGPGPQAKPHADCGCIGENNPFLGFVDGAPAESELLFSTAAE